MGQIPAGMEVSLKFAMESIEPSSADPRRTGRA